MFRARVLARTLLYVVFVTNTFFRWLFSNYVQDYSTLTNEHTYHIIFIKVRVHVRVV